MFDIDHLYLASQNIKLVKKKGEDNYDLIKDFEEGTEKYHQNMMLSYMIALLQDVDNSMNSLYKSIDNDTELPKRIADTIQSAETNQDTPYNFGALHEQVTRRNDYITGKTGIGPFALNVTSNVLTYLFGVSFNPEREICKYTQIGRLDMSIDVDGNSIAAWISAFINAHVDIVKDPWVSKLNVNPYTYNLINLLVRSGYGEGALWFCIQPVIKAMAEASNNFSSKYTKSRKNKKSRNDVILEAASNITGNKYTESDIKKELRRKVDWLDERGDYHKISYGTYCVIKVFDNIKNGNPIDQNEVLYAFFAIKPYSDALSNLVKYTKIDTRKQGKTFIEIQRYLDQYRRMFHEETSYGRILEMDKPIWDMDSLDRLINGSWIEFKTENGINEPLNVLLNQTFNGNKTFINNAIKYADKLIADDEEENASRFLKSLSQSMITLIKSIFVNEYAKDNNINIKELFVGPKSMAVQLDRLKYLILTDDRLKHLQNNALINALVSTPAKYDMKVGFKPVESPRFIKTIRKLDGGAIDENPLIDAWEDLLNDPRTLKFSRKLVVYAFVTSGESGKMGTLLKYLPPSFVRGELLNSTTDRGSFSDYISNVLANPHEIEAALNLDQIVQNNYTDYNFVSKTTLTYTDEKGQELNRFNFIKNEQDPLSPLVLIDTSNEVTAPYITVNKQGKRKFTNPAVDLNLYKKVEPGVYILMPKRGYSDRDGNIYEYSDNYGFDFNQNVGYTYENYQNAFRYLSQFIRNVRKNNKTIDNYSIFYNTIVNRLLNNAVEANADADFEYMLNRLAEIKKEKELNGEQLSKAVKKKDDPENFNTPQEDALVLSSEKTILSNEELAMWNKNGVGPEPKILVGSERSDPAFHSEQILRILNGEESVPHWGIVNGKRAIIGQLTGKDFSGLYLITKHDGLPFKKLLETKIPKIVHFSITGLGNTKYEPGVMKPDDLLDRIEEYIKDGLDPNIITMRIDPIIPGVTTYEMIEHIIQRSVKMGIKRIKFSIMDMYYNTSKSMESLGYDIEKYYGKDPKTNIWKFYAKQEYIDDISDFMLSMKDKYDISLHTCSERNVKPGIEKEGCLSVSAVNKMLGTNIEEKYEANNTQRDDCTCFGGKVDGLKYNAKCASHCVYCYAKHDHDAVLEYYNEDGTLKDMPLTRTSEEPRVVQPKSKEAKPEQQNISTNEVRKDLVIANSSKASDLRSKAKEVDGIITTRPKNTEYFKTPGMHFGNPFSYADYAGVKVKVKDAHEAVVAFEQWLRGEKYQDIEPQRRQWILDKINSGQLDNKPLVYYTNGVKDTDGQYKIYDYDTFPNHAHILLKLINEHKQNVLTSQQHPTTVSNIQNDPNNYSMTSGGAYGADTAWDIFARKFGITNIFHYRDSKNVKLSSNLEKQGVKASSLTEELMEYARQEMSKLIGRPLNDNVQDNLLARNYYLVTNADAIFAIATISGNSVKGGTNNAITAAKSMLKPIHVWDINTEKWYKYDYNTNSFVAEETPTLTERFAGIGSRDIQNYQVLKDGKWVSREQYVGNAKKKAALNAIREVFEKTFGKSSTQQQQTDQSNTRLVYTGKIESLKPNQVFVFGSNTQGRHGKGAALTARSKFGAVYGQAEGPQGQSYAIITKDLTKSTHPSRTPEQIKEQIHKLYEFARQNPEKQFLVAYSGIGQNLNAYSNEEMASMFASENIPSNIVFEKEFNNLVNSVQQPATTTETSQQNQLKTSVTYTPKGKTKQTYEVKEDNTGIHIFNKDGKEVFIKKGTVDRNKIIANYKWLNGDAVVVEHGGHEYIVMRSGDKRVVIQRITGKTKKFVENDIERQEIIDKANKKFLEKDAANNMQSTISELAKLGEQRKKDCE